MNLFLAIIFTALAVMWAVLGNAPLAALEGIAAGMWITITITRGISG